jgi:hypothetical protein
VSLILKGAHANQRAQWNQPKSQSILDFLDSSDL